MFARSEPCGTALMASATDMPSVNWGSATAGLAGFGSSLGGGAATGSAAGAGAGSASFGSGGGATSTGGDASTLSGPSAGCGQLQQACRKRPKTENAATLLMPRTILSSSRLDEPPSCPSPGGTQLGSQRVLPWTRRQRP